MQVDWTSVCASSIGIIQFPSYRFLEATDVIRLDNLHKFHLPSLLLAP